MKYLFSHTILSIYLIFIGIFIQGQNLKTSDNESFVELRKNYENMPENDKRALPYINIYLKKAKRENDYEEILQGYQDAVFFQKINLKNLNMQIVA